MRFKAEIVMKLIRPLERSVRCEEHLARTVIRFFSRCKVWSVDLNDPPTAVGGIW
jgi:hypothetical protein